MSQLHIQKLTRANGARGVEQSGQQIHEGFSQVGEIVIHDSEDAIPVPGFEQQNLVMRLIQRGENTEDPAYFVQISKTSDTPNSFSIAYGYDLDTRNFTNFDFKHEEKNLVRRKVRGKSKGKRSFFMKITPAKTLYIAAGRSFMGPRFGNAVTKISLSPRSYQE